MLIGGRAAARASPSAPSSSSPRPNKATVVLVATRQAGFIRPGLISHTRCVEMMVYVEGWQRAQYV
jgi:hypothetical protein